MTTTYRAQTEAMREVLADWRATLPDPTTEIGVEMFSTLDRVLAKADQLLGPRFDQAWSRLEDEGEQRQGLPTSAARIGEDGMGVLMIWHALADAVELFHDIGPSVLSGRGRW